jgi:hypothetical protein
MISDNVVIMTKNEFEDRLDSEFKRGARGQSERDELFKRAAFKDSGSRIMLSSDGRARIEVGKAVDDMLTDCLTLRWMNEVTRNWWCAHFSPARARIVASELLYQASVLENINGVEPIDPIPEKLRHGPICV